MRFERKPHHFRAGHPGPDGVDVLVNVDRFTQGMLFERGEIDFLCFMTDPDSLRFRRDPKQRPLLRIAEATNPTFIALNCELPPFTNRLVRQALNYAVDYHEIEHVVVEDAPWIFLMHFNTETACQPWLKGFRVRRFWPPIHLENCWFER